MPGRNIHQNSFSIHLGSPSETQRWAIALGALVEPGDVLILSGEMGSGKTFFVKGLAQGMNIPGAASVSSPSFTLINEYPGRISLYHADLYRLEREEELTELGLFERAEANAVMAVEWLDRFPRWIPKEHLRIHLSFTQKDQERLLSVEAKGSSHVRRIQQWFSLMRSAS